jgi:hypothetical protein
MSNTKKDAIHLLRSGEATVEEIRHLLHDKSIIVRANALEAIVSHCQRDEGLLDEICNAITPLGRQTRLLGNISMAHIAVGCLMKVGSDRAVGVARDLIASWPEPDRSDLLWYLKSEGLIDQ